MVALEHLLTAGFDPGHLVCRFPERTWSELMACAGGYAQSLDEEPRTQGGALVASDSGFLFLAALLACWSRGITPIVPPDTQPETVRELAPAIRAILTDRSTVPVGRPVLNPTPSSVPLRPQKFSPESVALELFTSGSSGERRRIPKRFCQLSRELANLQTAWGDRVQNSIPVATVSHLHIYGLLFRLLWPACRGEAFPDRSVFHLEEALEWIAGKRITLVSSPSHLRHFIQVVTGQEAVFPQATVFSSGGPLPRETALGMGALLGEAPIEVFGSTETGGIGHRQQSEGQDAAWIPFPGVEWAVTGGILSVRSPLLEEPDRWFETGDRAVACAGGGFGLVGRTDRVAKIFEKRVSLTEMEQILSRHPLLEEARVAMIAAGGGGLSRPGAAMILNAAGREALASRGKASVAGELKDYLRGYFEAPVLPRYWRVVEAFPRDAQGKVTQPALEGLFRSAAHEAKLEPEVVKRETFDGGLLLHLRIPADLAFFPGHFPEFPVVPGVCALRWVLEAIDSLRGGSSAILEMDSVKFHHFLRPGNRCQLEVKEKPGTGWWVYRLFDGEKKFASGRLRLDA